MAHIQRQDEVMFETVRLTGFDEFETLSRRYCIIAFVVERDSAEDRLREVACQRFADEHASGVIIAPRADEFESRSGSVLATQEKLHLAVLDGAESPQTLNASRELLQKLGVVGDVHPEIETVGTLVVV